MNKTFKNAPTHDKQAIIALLDELNTEHMTILVRYLRNLRIEQKKNTNVPDYRIKIDEPCKCEKLGRKGLHISGLLSAAHECGCVNKMLIKT